MDIPQETVKAMVRIVLAKLNLMNRTEAAIFAVRHNLAAQDASKGGPEERGRRAIKLRAPRAWSGSDVAAARALASRRRASRGFDGSPQACFRPLARRRPHREAATAEDAASRLPADL
jgi:hypothetical protein